MKSTHIIRSIINNKVSVFSNFRYLPDLGIFRIMQGRGVCRLIVSQRVFVNVYEPLYLYDQKHIRLLSLCVNDCGRPDEYDASRRVASFYSLYQTRYWIPHPVSVRSHDQEVLVEWAEYQTDNFNIDFERYNQFVRSGKKHETAL